jgi:hypothetical protein
MWLQLASVSRSGLPRQVPLQQQGQLARVRWLSRMNFFITLRVFVTTFL